MKCMYNGQCLGVCQMLESNKQECQIQLSLYVMREEQLLQWQWLPSTKFCHRSNKYTHIPTLTSISIYLLPGITTVPEALSGESEVKHIYGKFLIDKQA